VTSSSTEPSGSGLNEKLSDKSDLEFALDKPDSLQMFVEKRPVAQGRRPKFDADELVAKNKKKNNTNRILNGCGDRFCNKNIMHNQIK
jgi:hypothetical protein